MRKNKQQTGFLTQAVFFKEVLFKTAMVGLLLTMWLLAAGCEMTAGGEDDKNVTPPPETLTYSGVVDGETYTLKITGQAYELTIGDKKSTGAVIADESGTLTLKPATSDTPFTATVDGTTISAMSGTITFIDGSTQSAPTALTPTDPTGGNNQNGDGEGNENGQLPQSPAEIWFIDKNTTYTVTDGVVGDVASEIEFEYTDVTDEAHYKRIYTIQSEATTATPDYIISYLHRMTLTYDTTGTNPVTTNHIEMTTTTDYVSDDNPDTTTETISDSISIIDAETGLTIQQTTNSTTTTNGVETITNTTTNYTIQLLTTDV